MDGARLMTVLSCMLLAVCLVLGITTLTVLRHAIDENAVLQERVDAQLGELGACVETMKKEEDDAPSISVNGTEGEKSPDFRLQIENGRLCLRTAEGTLICTLNANPDTLPPADRAALAAGITVTGWDAALALMVDYAE